MFSYGCILPHTPLLFHDLLRPQAMLPTSIRVSLEQIAAEMKAGGVERIISIAGHPRYQRQGFSAYVSKKMLLSFRDLGDLTHENEVAMDWPAYTALRETEIRLQKPLIHPLDDAQLDFAHALPLWALSQQHPELLACPALFLNDFPAATSEERNELGQSLLDYVAASPIRYAVLVSTECAFVDTNAQSMDKIKEQNMNVRHAASAFYAQATSTALAGGLPCTSGVLAIAHPLFSQANVKYQEKTFEHAATTSFLIATIKPA